MSVQSIVRLFPVFCFALFAQTPSQQPEQKPVDLAETQADTLIERTSVSVVQAPVTVTDKDGNNVNGLQPNQFHLFDNGKEQDIRVDVAYQPLSLVIAIQCSDRTDSVLKQLKKASTVFGPQVLGENGEAAIIAFDHRIREMQSFTNDPVKLLDAIKKINAGSTSARLIDAVDKGVYLLRSRPVTRRKVILVVAENRDQASEGKMREALLDAQLSNVSIYTVNISRFVTNANTPQQVERSNGLPATAYSMPGGGVATPTSIAQKTQVYNRVEFVPAFKEIYIDLKGIFVAPPSEVFTHETGGAQLSFYRERGLEDAIMRIGEEIHSQYMISYNPNNKTEGGFHEIVIRLDRTDLKVRTRPGYYLASLTK
jgi:VWFA-related protein